jgi:hypothetical protein
MIASEPKRELGQMFDDAGGAGKPRLAQIALADAPDRETAGQRAHEQFRWFGLGWKVNADLPFMRWAEDELLRSLRSLRSLPSVHHG